ncbi:metalloprotease family M67C [Achlya hypogyna]|uniref:Metalloprotease family M67C n=1 Tax=Achlya hypogyna TaxID=1202772 RepID=A0A1V9Z2V7_ACHHY|nr:metalloprotease family M67C [Achlya hypogyna]
MASLELRREAEDRVRVRREALKKLCVVGDVKNNVSLSIYFQRANSMFRQCQVYVIERDYDHAYIYLWLLVMYVDQPDIRFICTLGSSSTRFRRTVTFITRSMPPTRTASMTCATTTRLRTLTPEQRCRQAMNLLERILEGMLREELDQLQLHHEDEALILELDDDVAPAPAPIKPERKDAAGLSLEARLQALRALAPLAVPTAPAAPVSSDARAKAMAALKQPGRSAPSPTPALPPPRSMQPAPLYPPHAALSRHEALERRTMLLKDEVRELSIPAMLVQEFIRIADPNTRQPPYGIETCGILTGTLKDQKLAITTLVIPKQTGSADTCTMTDENELFEYCIAHDLLTLGWIHTHPSQSCFLSSVDIHTQCGFQAMLAEVRAWCGAKGPRRLQAIAIVVAPRDAQKSIGVFRLTQPQGMELIQNCNLQGFHEHPTDVEIYSDAMQISWGRDGQAHVVDMR